MSSLPCIARCPECQWNLSTIPLGDDLSWALCTVEKEDGGFCLSPCPDPIHAEDDDTLDDMLGKLWVVRALAGQQPEECLLPPVFPFPLAGE